MGRGRRPPSRCWWCCWCWCCCQRCSTGGTINLGLAWPLLAQQGPWMMPPQPAEPPSRALRLRSPDWVRGVRRLPCRPAACSQAVVRGHAARLTGTTGCSDRASGGGCCASLDADQTEAAATRASVLGRLAGCWDLVPARQDAAALRIEACIGTWVVAPRAFVRGRTTWWRPVPAVRTGIYLHILRFKPGPTQSRNATGWAAQVSFSSSEPAGVRVFKRWQSPSAHRGSPRAADAVRMKGEARVAGRTKAHPRPVGPPWSARTLNGGSSDSSLGPPQGEGAGPPSLGFVFGR
jgi:hypothetical protein